MSNFPVFQEIEYYDPSDCFAIFSDSPWSFFLDSANAKTQYDSVNGYSYIAFDPSEYIIIKAHKDICRSKTVKNPYEYIQSFFCDYKLDVLEQLPPFQGGLVGHFSYDLCCYFENINPPKNTNNHYPDAAIGFYDVIISFDHILEKAWIVSTGFPEREHTSRLVRAKKRLNDALKRITQGISEKKHIKRERNFSFYVPQSPFDKQSYVSAVLKAQEYILNGDIFEVNLSQRFEAISKQKVEDYFLLYKRLRQINPAPFSAYLNLGDYQILSSSPERFLLCNNGQISTRPIKGTAPRGKTDEADKVNAQKLLHSDKDRSENIMIVDLMRNDLSKVCVPDSVVVKKFCGLETFQSVHHLVSVIEGKLKKTETPLSLLKACFPGGSITGVPKIRAMQIIYEIELNNRGPYCGSIGYVGFNHAMDTSIVIRTILTSPTGVNYQVGSAVVLDSLPDNEYEETLTKGAFLQKVLMEEDS